MVEACFQKDVNCFLRILKRIFESLNQNIDAFGNLRVFDGLPNQIQSFRSLFPNGGMRIAETT